MIARIRAFTEGTATPLASIFGSGFLVIASVLNAAVATYAFFAMALICLVAYLVGMVIRSNIARVEPLLHSGRASALTVNLERAADIALVPAYVISVTLYLRILSSYALGLSDRDEPFNEQVLTSTIIVGILAAALIRGPGILERLESWALLATFGIIGLVLAGFAVHNIDRTITNDLTLNGPGEIDTWDLVPVLAGTLIVVQGFEITRYLGSSYPAEVRISASRNAQIIASFVYLSFVLLATPMLYLLSTEAVSENGLIELARHVVIWLPIPLVLAAVFSQFSAAAADTIGASGNMREFFGERISENQTWWLICGAALVLTWAADTLQILAFASRAFALYYCIQCLVALSLPGSPLRRAGLAVLAVGLLAITIFAVPVG